MKTVVLDDDPTGTQSATGVRVLLEFSIESIADALAVADSVYVQTNSRAIDEPAAIDLVSRIRHDAIEAARRVGEPIRFVLRGDSTLRGHVFAETEVFVSDDSVIVFVPAFPAGGRTTIAGTHYVRVGSQTLPVHETEFARDPVFPVSTAVLADFVAEQSGRATISVALDQLRSAELERILRTAPGGSVVLPDVEDDDDISRIARAIEAARQTGRDIVVRCAAPLAAALAGVRSTGLLSTPLVDIVSPALLVCGSHTDAATEQLARLTKGYGPAIVVDTTAALLDPIRAGDLASAAARVVLADRGLAVVTTERTRLAAHNTLEHGEAIMTALTRAVHSIVSLVDVVIAKGGITSAEIAHQGIGAQSAMVLGQLLPGVSVWELESFEGRRMLYVVVPGNVGGPDTLAEVLVALQHRGTCTSPDSSQRRKQPPRDGPSAE